MWKVDRQREESKGQQRERKTEMEREGIIV
jgi:hypothetical protein